VEGIMQRVDEAGVPHPNIVSESGRATVAHHSVLLFDIFDVSRFESNGLPEKLPADSHEHLRRLMEVRGGSRQERSRNATTTRCSAATRSAPCSRRARPRCAIARWRSASSGASSIRIAEEIRGLKYIPDELQDLETAIADVYFGNFSVFQSLPDSWAIEQLFPIMPIHRLGEILPARPCWPTSPATATARSTGSSTCTT
jgi:arginine decarboxylase